MSDLTTDCVNDPVLILSFSLDEAFIQVKEN